MPRSLTLQIASLTWGIRKHWRVIYSVTPDIVIKLCPLDFFEDREYLSRLTNFSHSSLLPAKLLIISSEGASGDYPGCTDLAYTRAVSSNVDVLDCPVQMTKDGIPICLGSINLMDRTTVDQSSFSNLSTDVPELGTGNGIFTFNLNWSELRRLTRKSKPTFFPICILSSTGLI